MEVFISGIRGQEKNVCTDYGDRVVFYHHTDRNELAEKLDLIAPVLFSRNGKLGFEPEGSYQQFNDVFAEMVALAQCSGNNRKRTLHHYSSGRGFAPSTQ